MTTALETKERPILFSGPMVKVLLEGRKTQTRRMIKEQPGNDRGIWMGWKKIEGRGEFLQPLNRHEIVGLCPYGKPGDRLWVREAWAPVWPDDSPVPLEQCNIEYRADSGAQYPGGWDKDTILDADGNPRWKASIHMPRWASRITLEITGVRVERLQDISAKDCLAEGIKLATKDENLWKAGLDDWPWMDWFSTPEKAFSHLWETIHGTDSWATNPWLWVISFRKIA